MRAVAFFVLLCAPSIAAAAEESAYAGSVGLVGGTVVQGPAIRRTGGAMLGAAAEGWRRAWAFRLLGAEVFPAARTELGFYGPNGKAEWLGVRGGAALGLAGRAGAWTFGLFGGAVGYRAPLCFGEGVLASYCVQTNGVAPTASLVLGARGGLGSVAVDVGVDVLTGNPVWSGPSFRIGVRAGF